jgi:hypothetical protein
MKFICNPDFMTPFLIVKDFTYYIENEQDINEWADKCVPGWQLTGMILEFKNEQDRLAFLLRWN